MVYTTITSFNLLSNPRRFEIDDMFFLLLFIIVRQQHVKYDVSLWIGDKWRSFEREAEDGSFELWSLISIFYTSTVFLLDYIDSSQNKLLQIR